MYPHYYQVESMGLAFIEANPMANIQLKVHDATLSLLLTTPYTDGVLVQIVLLI